MIVLRVVLWIFFFPFKLTHFGLEKQRRTALIVGLVLSVALVLPGCSDEKNAEKIKTPTSPQVEKVDSEKQSNNDVVPDEKEPEVAEKAEKKSAEVKENVQTEPDVEQETANKTNQATSQLLDSSEDMFKGYRLIKVDGGNQSGHREPNVVVDVGFGDREYWAFTNEHAQLVKVVAKQVTLQDEDNEHVLSTGRYYSDEAKVPGVESKTLDEGHVIADSLGGVSNAYNITPQESTLNRHGDQAYMEKNIRDARGCTDFVAIITYPNTETQIPSHYSYTYTLKGNVIHDEFDNVNPDEVNAELNQKDPVEVTKAPEVTETSQTQVSTATSAVVISELDKKSEFVAIKNTGSEAVDISGWTIVSVRGNQTFTFPSFVLNAGSIVKVGDTDKNQGIEFYWLDGRGTWNNSQSDPAELYNTAGQLVYRFED